MKLLTIIAFTLLLLEKVVSVCLQRAPGQFYDPICDNKGGQCMTVFQQVLDRPICIFNKACRYSDLRKSCIDLFGVCSKSNGCCRAIAQSAVDGRPICECLKSIPPSKCTDCKLGYESKKCEDQNKVCTQSGGCCRLNQWGGPHNQMWDICLCQRDKNQEDSSYQNHKCDECLYDKSKAACIDENGYCEKQGLCCQAQIGQFSSTTGLPVCKCVKSSFCPKCQRKDFGQKCFDPTGECQKNDKLCCGLDKFGNGVQFCHCHGCINFSKCAYNPNTKSCQGQCGNSKECCKFSGKYEEPKRNSLISSIPIIGDPICQCQKKTSPNDQCSTDCQYNSKMGVCRDVTGNCQRFIGKCCKYDKYGKLCLCQKCLPQPEVWCRYVPKSDTCVSISCPFGNCCYKAKDSFGNIDCICRKCYIDVPIFEGDLVTSSPILTTQKLNNLQANP